MTKGAAVLRCWGARALAIGLALALALVGAAFSAAPASAAVLPLTPVKIMPLGDSITNGVGASGGYRLELKDLMVPKGYSFDYVGGVATGPYEIEDRQHEGHNGYKIGDIAAIAQAQVNTYHPSVITLLLGTNDVLTDTALDTAPDRLGSLMDSIYAVAPTVSIVVGSIPPLADPTDDAQARAYNAALPGVVQARVAAGRNASFADIYPAVSVTDLVDGVHPNADGYFKMAKVWLPALQAILPAPPGSSADGCPCSVWPSTAVPAVPQVSSTTPTEVGVRFRPEKYGYITGIRFYKGSANTGVHKGNLWSRNGTLLASATFTNETASGWQQVTFGSPVVVWPWTTYVASYFAPAGHWAADPGVFTSTEIVSTPLRLLAAGQSGGNGWSVTSSTGGFPSAASSQSANFWVDVVFTPVTPAPPPPPPSAPTGLRASSVSSSQISLVWNDVIGETGYRLERTPAGVNKWAAIGVTARDVLAYTDGGLPASTSYTYRVVATSRNGDSAPSAVTTVKTLAPSPPPTPTGVTATAASSAQVDVAWQDVTGESGYVVQRSADGVNGWIQVGTVGPDVVGFSNTGLAASTTYYYRVMATNVSGSSSPSAVVSATTLAPPPPPAPAGVTATAVSSSQVDVSWQNVTGESGYQVQRSANGSTGWAQVGTVGPDVVVFSNTGLAASTTYYYRVVATSASGDSAPSAVASATTLAPPAPGAPGGVTATAVSSSQVDVGWQDVAGESGYAVQRSADGVSGWAQVGTTGQDVVSFSNTGLAASTTYYYRVIATSPNGDSAPSTVVGAATFPPPPPAAPGGMTATAVSSSQIDVAWNDVTGESGYAVQRSPSGSGGWVQVGTTGQDVESFSDVGLAASTTYYYRVVATSANGDSAPSAVASATTLAPPPPATPAGVTATAMSPSQVDVAWQDVTGESGYVVQRSANGSGGWVQVGATGQDVESFSDVGLAASTTYYYRVVATSANGDSAPSAVASATTFAPPAPGAPGGVTATAVSSSQVDVGWQDVTGESGYVVQRSADGVSGWAQVGTTGQDVVSFSNTGLIASTTYYYRVVATSASGDSAPSAVVGATTLAPPAPATPAGVTATAVSSSQVDVGWQNVAGESGYQVQRSANGSTGWAQVGTTGQDVVSFSNTGLAASTTYYYRVVATSASGDSAPSAVASATTLAPPAPPTPAGVTATAVSSSQVDVGWQNVAGESGYAVQRSADGVSGWAQVGTVGPDVVSFSNTGLAASTTYYYRVIATSANGDSAPSAVVSATTAADTTPPTVPTNLKATAAKKKVNLSWTGSVDTGSGVAGYRVYQSSSGSTGTFTLATTATGTSVSLTVATGVTLWYRVTAYDRAGNESAPSSVVQATAK